MLKRLRYQTLAYHQCINSLLTTEKTSRLYSLPLLTLKLLKRTPIPRYVHPECRSEDVI